MKVIKTKDQKKESKNWTLPGNTLSQDEFIAGIRKAEKGPFFTIQESMEHFEQWLKSREKK
jgi:predicted transcriptional regulator